MNIVGDQRHLFSIALQKEANATLVGTKQDIMLLPNARIKRAVKQLHGGRQLKSDTRVRSVQAGNNSFCRRKAQQLPLYSLGPAHWLQGRNLYPMDLLGVVLPLCNDRQNQH